jgi:hypothetical protein
VQGPFRDDELRLIAQRQPGEPGSRDGHGDRPSGVDGGGTALAPGVGGDRVSEVGGELDGVVAGKGQ